MRFSVNWLKQWVNIDLSPLALAERLTDAGLEVDAIEPVAASFSDVVVAEITACEPHPDADKLRVCMVHDGGDAELQVVCGAPNARAGIRIPFARVGADLGGGFKIKKARLRGVESFGMACSARELGLSDDHEGLLELPTDAPLGKDLRDYLGLEDVAIELDLTPNRADCLGMIGLARDVAACCDAEFIPLNVPTIEATIGDEFAVELEAPADCPRYVGRVIRGIDPQAATPLWMVEALRRAGLRSISATVDCTNFVLLELGQPTHAFDLDRLDGRIIVRRGREGETLQLLDEKIVELDPDLLTICDESGPVALAGIMGGLASGVTEQTCNVFLESAWFNPAVIAGKARSVGLHTDASHRFERGVDPQGQVRAVERFTELLLSITGGEAGPLVIAESAGFLPESRPVPLRLERVNRVLGSQLDAVEVEDILRRLGMEVSGEASGWQVRAPSRRFDIAIEEDLIEEVARIHGYNQLPATPPAGELRLKTQSERHVPPMQLRETLVSAGYHEIITYSFVDRESLRALGLDQQVLELANPIASDMGVMRTALLPGLLTALARNQRRQHDRVRLFETGHVFLQGDELVEVERVAGVAQGPAWPEQWGQASRPLDFYDLKKDVERLLELRGTDAAAADFRAVELPWLHPGQAAELIIDDSHAGWLGALHPAMANELGLKGDVFAFELDTDRVLEREVPFAKDISRFPSVRRDLAFIVPEGVHYREIRECVTDIAGHLLSQMVIFDVYAGANVEKGYKSIAIGLILQDVSCTLTDEVVEPMVAAVIAALADRLDAQHRG